jgi:tetratricopeptide (TPR) repeat protein
MSRLIQIADWSGEKRANVVFVHGLGGHPYATWQRPRADDTLWPLWLAEDVKGVSVYSFGYISPATNWLGTAMPLLDEAANALRLLLNEPRLREGPIVFVCHSLGGLIVKQILRSASEQRSNPETADFLSRVRRVVFVATPHTGSGKATLLEKLGFWAWGSDSARDLVANKPELRDLNFGYRIFAGERKEQLRHLSYYEMVPTVFGRMVEPDSADPGLPDCTPTPIRENHVTIAKPGRRDELVYTETKNFISSLAPEPAVVGQLRVSPLEPFIMDWSWSHLMPKLVRIAAIVLIAAGIWLGVPRLHELYSAIFSTQAQLTQTRLKVDDTRSDVAEVLRIVSQKEGVPLETLRAILKEMGEVVTTTDSGEIGRLLTVKAAEFRTLAERLNRLSSGDPEVARLRLAAVDALKSGRFADADSRLAAAEARDLAGLGELEAIAKQKRLSAAETRAERGAAAMLRTNPDAYQEAATHYAEAARLAVTSDPKIARRYAVKQGQSLFVLGFEFGRNQALLDAIDHFQDVRGTVDRSGDPLEWASVQVELGNAFATLGHREVTADRMEKAVAIYRDAFEELTQQRAPLEWAKTQNKLGNVLKWIGERESGIERLEEAAAAYREALKENTRERVPVEWARQQNNLAIVLKTIGQRTNSKKMLEESVESYRNALMEWTRERVPSEWALAQNNLANSLSLLGKLDEAVLAYREALKESTRERVPIIWAGTQNNLGVALLKLGLQETETGKLHEAAAAFREALKERTRERVPLEWASTQYNFAHALLQLGLRESRTENLVAAVDAYRERLKAPELYPFQWADAQHDLGVALATLEMRGNGVENLREALTAYREALKKRTRERAPLNWATTQHNIGLALARLGLLEESIAAFNEALKETTREAAPFEWTETQLNLGIALGTFGRRTGVAGDLDKATATCREGLDHLALKAAETRYATLREAALSCSTFVNEHSKM